MTENEMVGWYHQLNGHEFEQDPGDGEGQGSLTCSGWKRIRNNSVTEQKQWKQDFCECSLLNSFFFEL